MQATPTSGFVWKLNNVADAGRVLLVAAKHDSLGVDSNQGNKSSPLCCLQSCLFRLQLLSSFRYTAAAGRVWIHGEVRDARMCPKLVILQPSWCLGSPPCLPALAGVTSAQPSPRHGGPLQSATQQRPTKPKPAGPQHTGKLLCRAGRRCASTARYSRAPPTNPRLPQV